MGAFFVIDFGLSWGTSMAIGQGRTNGTQQTATTMVAVVGWLDKNNGESNKKKRIYNSCFDHLLQVVVGKVFAKFLVEIGQSAFLYSTSKIGFKYCKRGFHIIDLLRFKSWNG